LLGDVERIKINRSSQKTGLFRFKGYLGTNKSSLSLLEVEIYYVLEVNVHNITAIDETAVVGDYVMTMAFASGVTIYRLHFR
jgi:hypothetical protein